MFGTSVQLARPVDSEAVAACVRDAYARYVERIGREPAPLGADYAALIARDVVYVLRDPATDRVCGVLVLEPEEGGMFIENVAVHPLRQGHGLGRLLMAFAEDRAKAAGMRELRLYTNEVMTENIAFYRRLGFEEIDRRVDAGFRRVFMRKVLD